jgi:DinB superfamily
MPPVEIEQLLGIFDRAYNKRSWHGTNLRGSIRGLTAADASRRPARGRHNIWEIVVHAAYWKYAVWRRLTGEKRGGFELKGSNWFERPTGSTPSGSNAGSIVRRAGEAGWAADVALLDRAHQSLRSAIERVPPETLHRSTPGSEVTAFELISGIAAHDLYHTGQIQLIKRLAPGDRRRAVPTRS